MADNPLDRAVRFFKPLLDPEELNGLAAYARPDEAPRAGVNVWRSDDEPRFWHVDDGTSTFTIFAAVHPMPVVPAGAVAIADLHDANGDLDSHVLWYPDRQAVVVPFDPDDAVDAYRRERYSSPVKQTALPRPLLGLYYLVGRRLLPPSVRKALRRSIARKALLSHTATKWPFDDSTDALQRLMLRSLLLGSARDRLDFAWFWPEGHTWAVALTHDVETASGLANVGRVTALEIERGLRSSINLVPLDYDAPEGVLTALRESGFEIGVHGYTHDGLLFSNWSTFQKRVGTINEFAKKWSASGFRSPATYRNPDWFKWMDFEYDSSFSNSAPCEPQPGGSATFYPYPIDDLIELPITLPQDHTLFELLGHADHSMWIDGLERIRAAGGMACILTHPDPTPSYVGGSANLRHYASLLDHVKEWGAWTPLPRDLARWWTAREQAAPAEAAAMAGGVVGHARVDDAGRLYISGPEDPAARTAFDAALMNPTPSVASRPAPSTQSA